MGDVLAGQSDARFAGARDHTPADAAVLAAELRVSLSQITRRIRRERPEAALTPTQYAVLVELESIGPLTPRELAGREHVQPPSMTRTIQTLHTAGFVLKQGHPTDRRQLLVQITDLARDEVDDMRRRRDAWLATRVNALDDHDRRTLAHAIAIFREMDS